MKLDEVWQSIRKSVLDDNSSEDVVKYVEDVFAIIERRIGHVEQNNEDKLISRIKRAYEELDKLPAREYMTLESYLSDRLDKVVGSKQLEIVEDLQKRICGQEANASLIYTILQESQRLKELEDMTFSVSFVFSILVDKLALMREFKPALEDVIQACKTSRIFKKAEN